MMLTEFLVPTYVQMLTGLKNWLKKAEDQRPNGGAEPLLSARLVSDMFPLSTQIRFTCVQAIEGVYRLQGRDLPPMVSEYLDEGRAAGEQPGTMAEAIGRIDAAIALIEQAAGQADELAGNTEIAHSLPMGMTFDMTALQFGRDWSLPQFYFHICAAYNILRAQGVELGKADYIGHAIGYLRKSG
ncbi:DUF1993 domain-containing protein [Sphingopyxis yananensis]|uniref:DUF1993 domain-containing protein n=1 Tax=Sphingopyxis yananensis TaxID=2886687 RepID=UPI001D107060|nr:DUF1993 domain-containing protein [Sphingopyxis yananensis]MCC2602982.1 DUF1993 domain-containing protein [Sphingopyxis yananensis]